MDISIKIISMVDLLMDHSIKKMSLRKKQKYTAFSLILILTSIYVYFKDPTKGPILPCIFNKITGYYCPGCGMTRAVHCLMHFDFKGAFHYNLLVFLIPVACVIYYLLQRKGRNLNIYLSLLLFLTLAFGVVRNIYPQLAP